MFVDNRCVSIDQTCQQTFSMYRLCVIYDTPLSAYRTPDPFLWFCLAALCIHIGTLFEGLLDYHSYSDPLVPMIEDDIDRLYGRLWSLYQLEPIRIRCDSDASVVPVTWESRAGNNELDEIWAKVVDDSECSNVSDTIPTEPPVSLDPNTCIKLTEGRQKILKKLRSTNSWLSLCCRIASPSTYDSPTLNLPSPLEESSESMESRGKDMEYRSQDEASFAACVDE